MPRVPTALAVALALAALAACGGTADGAASTASASPSASGDGVRWARCMREHGVQVDDPSGSGPVRIGGDAADSAAFDAARKACQQYAPRADLDPSRQQQVQKQVLAFTRCMREHGVNLPDPQSKGDGSVVIGGPGDGGDLPDPQSPTFRTAQQACQNLLPKPPGSDR